SFLGYARVLTGESARLVAEAAGLPGSRQLALRRSALKVSEAGPLTGVVEQVTSTPEQLRLVVDVPGAGRLDAVAPLDARLVVGESVRLAVDATRVAQTST